ncbi:MAG: hypothetical protein RR190_00170 [Bacteroidales bacterium]
MMIIHYFYRGINKKKMEYLNQFHKESTERCLKKIAEMKTPINYEEELKRHQEMHRKEKEREGREGVLREKEINQMVEFEAKESGLWIP